MSMMRLADYVATYLADHKIDTVFMVTGGMAMHLNDALALNCGIRKICCHHEQACALAAEAYAHVCARPALVQVTSGPGAINAMTGVYGAFVDAVPMFVISGQPKRELTRAGYGLKHTRQVGEQESEAIEMAAYITKYASRITDPGCIRYELDKAMHIMGTGRPGPVWLEIPLDVQAALINPGEQRPFVTGRAPSADLAGAADDAAAKLRAAKRPLFVIGPGLRMEKEEQNYLRLAKKLGYPVVCAGTLDIVTGDHPLYAGAMGALGSRAGNIAIQNADLIVFLGVTMHVAFTTYNWRAMGKNAHKIVVECDPGELERPQHIGNQNIIAKTGDFIRALEKSAAKAPLPNREEWLTFCKSRLELLPAVPQHMRTVDSSGRIGAYWFTQELFSRLGDSDIVVPGNATAGITAQQAGKLRPGQRLIANFGSGPMGFALPASVGAAIAGQGRRIVCLDGDGSLMMNMQELATVKYNNLPVIIFIYNNGGYASIRQSQTNFFSTRIGYGPENGLGFPEFTALANSFGIPSCRVEGGKFMEQLDGIFKSGGPVLVEVMLDHEQGFEPKISSKRLPDGRMISMPPEDMYPFLDRDELQAHLLFPLDKHDW